MADDLSDEEIDFQSPYVPRNLFDPTSPPSLSIDRGRAPIELNPEQDDPSILIVDEQIIMASSDEKDAASGLTYTLNGITYAVTPNKAETTTQAMWTKKERSKLTGKDRIDFIARIQAKQQQPFHAITISKTDPEKLTNTHSISKLLEEHRRNMEKYDLLEAYTIVVPKIGSFEPANPNYGQLQTRTGTSEPITYDLHTDYLRLSVREVAESTKWYATFAPADRLIREDLLWATSYYEKNVETALYNTVHSKWMESSRDERGGPLFLKLLLNQVTTTSEANIKALTHIIETYSIKASCIGEDIDEIVTTFKAIFNNLEALKQGLLPPDSTRNLLRIFQTTSVTRFNEQFEQMEKQLMAAEIQRSVDPTFIVAPTGASQSDMGNNMKTINYIHGFAQVAYRNLVQQGEWDAVLQSVPGKSALILQNPAAHTQAQQPTAFNGDSHKHHEIRTWELGKCFNCGGDHMLRDCKVPRDKARIEANRAKHPNGNRSLVKTPGKFRRPAENESNKKVIDGKPHTWNPAVGRRGWWIPDETPNDGQPNDGAPPQAALTQQVQPSQQAIAALWQQLTTQASPSQQTSMTSPLTVNLSGTPSLADSSLSSNDPSIIKLQQHQLLSQLRATMNF